MCGRWPFPNVVSVHVALATADEMVVAVKRAATQAFHPGSWSFGIEEGLEWNDLDAPGGALHNAARRGLAEELGLTADDIEMRSLAVVALLAERPTVYPCWIAVARLALSSRELRQTFALRPSSGSEKDRELDAIDFVLPSSVDISAAYHPGLGPLHPTAAYRVAQLVNHGLI
jgi:8-oxo-dGTP pyrophosphatase MutT (NUDIX family)